MSALPAFVASDVHLGSTPAPREVRFRQWLEEIAPETQHIVLNGDVFDFWFEYGSVIPKGYTRTLGLLSRIVDSGVRVDMIGGNHDWWGGSFLEDEIGVHFHRGSIRLELAGHRALIAHGDGLGRGDLGYRMLQLVLRGRLTRWGFRWIHPDVGVAIARLVSQTDSRNSEPDPETLERSRQLERWARDQLLVDDDLELVLLGHTHLPRKVEIAPGRFYVNSGDWLHHCSYVEIHEGEPPLLRHWSA